MSAQTAHASTGLPASIFREVIVAIVHLDTLAATAKQVRGAVFYAIFTPVISIYT